MEKITIVIPNFNGYYLIKKNLPVVIKNSPNCKVIVVDDSSNDDSVKLIRKKFRTVKLLVNQKNLGFAMSANIGVKAAKTQYVLLLNTDVSPQRNYLTPALKHFKKDSVFAVGLQDQSHEKGKIIPRGRGAARFKRGFVEHYAAIPERGMTLWTSGGSSLIDREKFIELNGFDSIFKPFYWEDVDLGFRAWQQGFQCLFEPLSKVDHYHEEGTIVKNSSKFRIRTSAYKNQILFVWKNIQDFDLILLHIIWMPYHLVRAIARFDLAFLNGLLLACASLPELVIKSNPIFLKHSDKEILDKFR